MEEEHDSLSDALLRKEKELQHIAKLRIAQLQEQVTLKDQYIAELQLRLKRICEDFNYNFQLIEERDRELHSFEQQVTLLTSAVKAKEADITDLRRALQSKDDDIKGEVEFLQQQLEDALQSVEVFKARDSQMRVQEAEALKKAEEAEKMLRNKDQELFKANSMLQVVTTEFDEERNQLNQRLTTEQEDSEKLKEVLEEHQHCSRILQDTEKRLKDEANGLQLLISSKDEQLEDSERRMRQVESEKTDLLRELQRLRKDREATEGQLKQQLEDQKDVSKLKEQLRSLQEALSSMKVQKETLEDVISSLERELDLERKERVKDRRTVREAQSRLDSESAVAQEKNAQWQAIAESRAEELATARVTFTQKNLVQAEEQARHFEREFLRLKKATELDASRQQEEMRKNVALQTHISILEREKARFQAELRQMKSTNIDLEPPQLRQDVERLYKEKATVDVTLKEMRQELEGRREQQKDLEEEVQRLKKTTERKNVSSEKIGDRRDAMLDTVPSRDVRLSGLKQRIALVKDQLETKFQGV